MKKNSLKNEKIQGKKPVDYFLTFFLAVSIIFSIIIVTNCNNKNDSLTPAPDETRPPEFGGGESSSIITSLFKSAAQGAAGQIGGAAAGWAMSALGLSAASPDYTAQLDKIDEDLQEVISELSTIEAELNQIYEELAVINCTEWTTGLTNEKSRIDALMQNYNTFMATANTGGTVTQAELSDWVDQVMASGAYTSQESMNQILQKFANQLYSVGNSGIIPSCVQTLTSPKEDSLGLDTTYYNQVAQYTNYYYAYQVKGLMLYNEALHYRAWQAAGSPNSDSLSSDSTAYVCSNSKAVLFCNESAAAVNTLYNDLIVQLTAGGATYSDENFTLQYKQSGPILWPFSLEDFTIAAGDNCKDPLNSGSPCGITANINTNQNMKSVTYKGYSGWLVATSDELTALLTGWTTGTAGSFLQNKRGFQNMTSKIILSSDTVVVNLPNSGDEQTAIIFIDTETKKSLVSGVLFNTAADFANLLTIKKEVQAGHCYPATSDFYDFLGNATAGSTGQAFYGASGGSEYCSGKWYQPLYWANPPAWIIEFYYNDTKQFRWPVVNVSTFKCTEGRSSMNTGNVWTMCGDDFTAWFDYYVPRPVTCDNAGAGVTCGLSSTNIAKAKKVFGRQKGTEVY